MPGGIKVSHPTEVFMNYVFLYLNTCSKFWGNFEGILGNPEEIPHIGWELRGSKGLISNK